MASRARSAMLPGCTSQQDAGVIVKKPYNVGNSYFHEYGAPELLNIYERHCDRSKRLLESVRRYSAR